MLSGHATVGGLVAIGAINGASSAFVFPASAGLLPADRAGAASCSRPTRSSGCPARRPGRRHVAVGGVLVAGVGPGWGLAVDAVSFVVAAACFARCGSPRRTAAVRNVLTDLREGWSAFRSRTWLWVVVLAFSIINAVHAAGWFNPRPEDRRYRLRRGRAGDSCSRPRPRACSLCGLVLLRVRFRRPLFVGMLGVLAWSPLMLVLAAEPAVLCSSSPFLAGVAIELFGLGWDLSMQQHVPPQLLSRVYAYDALGSILAIPVGQVLAGPAAAWLGVQRGGRAVRGGHHGGQPDHDRRSGRSPSSAHRSRRAGARARQGVSRRSTSSCRSPLVATALPPAGPSVPARSVNRPPASRDDRSSSAARSYSGTSGSAAMSTAPSATQHVGPEVAVGAGAPDRRGSARGTPRSGRARSQPDRLE